MQNTTSLELLAQLEDKEEERAVATQVAQKKRDIKERTSAICTLIAGGFEDPKVSNVVAKMAEWTYDDIEEIRHIGVGIAQIDSKPLRKPLEGKQPGAVSWKGSEQFRVIHAYWRGGVTP